MGSWKIGRAFGIDLYIHWSFFIAPLLVFLSGQDEGLASALLDAFVVLCVFGCVLLHELGHALAARQFGIGTQDITMYPIGGVARLERVGEHPGEEIAIAVAGPAVNVVIAAGLWLGMHLFGLIPSSGLALHGNVAERLLMRLLIANVCLVVFNMIPAFPMDGGRVLRAILSTGFGRLRATEISVTVARVFAFLFLLAAFAGLPTLAFIGVMLLMAGRQELNMIRAAEFYRARESDPYIVSTMADFPQPSSVVPAGFTGFKFDRQARTWIQYRDGQPVGACLVDHDGPRW